MGLERSIITRLGGLHTLFGVSDLLANGEELGELGGHGWISSFFFRFIFLRGTNYGITGSGRPWLLLISSTQLTTNRSLD